MVIMITFREFLVMADVKVAEIKIFLWLILNDYEVDPVRIVAPIITPTNVITGHTMYPSLMVLDGC